MPTLAAHRRAAPSEFIDIIRRPGAAEEAALAQPPSPRISAAELEHRLGRYGLKSLREIRELISTANLGRKSNLNRPTSIQPTSGPADAFKGRLAWRLACLLNHDFRGWSVYRQSAPGIPIVGR